jgi:pyruvate formate lyase activating enzyme
MSMRCLGRDACRDRCVNACPKGAIEEGPLKTDVQTGEQLRTIHVKRDLCDNCGACADKCYAEALTMCGKDYTSEELVARLLQDKNFFDTSGGGVTVSGGEPLSQADFTVEVLKGLKEAGVHTALDTTGFAPWEALERTMPWVDLYLYDLKHMDSAKHKAAVGVPNEIIHENARLLAGHGKALQIRIPVIPRFNDDEENIRATAEFCAGLGSAVQLVQLLPYHQAGRIKYERVGRTYRLKNVTPPPEAFMEKALEVFRAKGLPCQIH